MTSPNDPYKTQPLPPLTETLARPVQLPLGALAALVVVPALILAALLLLWATPQQRETKALALLPSPTLSLPRPATDPGLPRAIVAYASPDGPVVGALEPGRSYRVVARSGLAWVQLDVATTGEPVNLVWVAASDVPETNAVADLADLATPVPSVTPQIVYVAAPAPALPAPIAPATVAEPALLTPEPTAVYIVPPPTPAPRSVVVITFPTSTPCSLRDIGSTLTICNGVRP